MSLQNLIFTTPPTFELISFDYDAQGRRIKKKTSKTVLGLLNENNTYYMRDANGEVMAIYDAPFSTERIQPTLGEWHVYGSESHGRFETMKPTEQTFYNDSLPTFSETLFTRKLRFREFEMKDHLGNVRVTFSDLKLQPVQQDSFRLDRKI